jgi:cell wall-associated NlpC family hydrolase
MHLSRSFFARLNSMQMPYCRARLITALAIGAACYGPAVRAQAPLPIVLRGVHATDASDSANRPDGAAVNSSGNSSDIGPAASASKPTESSTDLARPFAIFSASARSLGDSMVALARAQIGRRYRFGGSTPEHGFDCSGLVRYVLAVMHISVPRTAHEQAHSGILVARDTSQLRPGDLVTFGSKHRISHIGIYVGGGRFVQASSKAGRVIETPLNRRLVAGVKPWRGARRVVPDDSTLTSTDPLVPDRDDGG